MTVGSPVAPYRHVYIHVPFCGRRCSYCDFAIAVRRSVPVSEFVDSLSAEMATRDISAGLGSVETLYLGGGTPSKLGGDGIARVVDLFPRQADVDGFPTEITIEANPEDVNEGAAAAWARAGVNRVSLGVQSFDPGVLTWMHREHSPERVREAVQVLRDAGIRNLSLDLIFALPPSVPRDWEWDLALALELEPDHLSVYGLTVEPQTPLGKWTARGEVSEAPEERYEQEFLAADARLTAAGFEHYEVSNYGRLGRQSRHNSSYWTGVPYLGLGPAAHGFDGARRRWNRAAYADWSRTALAGADPMEGSESIGAPERLAEEVYLGMRTSLGLDIRQNERKTVSRWVDEGWGMIGGDRLRLTPRGWLRLDALAAALTELRSR